NNDGDFLDTSESGYTTGTLTNGVALITLAPALSIGTVRLRARVTDKAGNEGTSSTSSVQVVSSGSGYTATDLTAQVDPFTGDGDHGPLRLHLAGDLQPRHASQSHHHRRRLRDRGGQQSVRRRLGPRRR